MVEAHFPEVKQQLGEAEWRALIDAFVRDSTWPSHFYGDLGDEFTAYLVRLAG
jgi:hypothetical protein